jgi:hypothetical protein
MMATAGLFGITKADLSTTMILDKNYVGKFKVGKQEVTLKSIMVTDATIVYSKTCNACSSQTYDTSAIKDPVY